MRIETDKHMSSAWIIVPLLPIIGIILFFVGIILAAISSVGSFTFTNATGTPTVRPAPFAFGAFFAIIFLFEFSFFVIGIIYAVMLYKLVKRRNTHFARQLFLYEDLINLARELGTRKGVDISLPLNNLDRTAKEARFEETEKSAALWAILSYFTGIASLYVFYFLMKDFFKHERKQDIFIDDLTKLLTSVGIPVNLPRRNYPIPDRSFILYFILSLITIGIFTVYWVHVLISDPNNHFQHQALVEDTITAQVTPQFA